MLAHHPPPAVAGRRLKIKYMTQAKTRPPGFVLSCSRPDDVPQSYVRYLVNSLREAFDMPGVPIRVALAHLRQSVRRQGEEEALTRSAADRYRRSARETARLPISSATHRHAPPLTLHQG